MITLGIDTSTARGSVALFALGDLVLAEDFMADRSHSSSLFAALERARSCVERIDRVAIGLGPGSYAGVRISIASALGFELALGARIVGIPSVAAMETDATEYLAIGDARRDSFYFAHVQSGVCHDGPRLVTEPELRDLLTRFSLPVLSSTPLAPFPTAQIAFPSAKVLAQLACDEVAIIAEGNLEPMYLREPYITKPKPRYFS